MSVDLSAYAARPSLPHTVTKEIRYSRAFMSTHLGASQWPAACGYDPHLEPIELFQRFTGLASWEVEESDAIALGEALEDGLRRLAAKRLGLNIVACPTYLHPRHEWSFATPDGFCEDASILEVKTTGIAHDGEPGDLEEWGLDESDVPPRVLTQVMGQMTVMRAWLMTHAPNLPLTKEAHVAVLIGGRARGFRLYRIDWDEDLARRLFDRVARFWAGVKTNTPPPERETEAFYKYLERRYPKHSAKKWIEADEALRAEIVGWSRMDAQMKDLKRKRQTARNNICMRIGDAEGIRGLDDDGVPFRLPWRFKRGREGITKDLLETTLRHVLGDGETERILEMCTKRGNGHRQLGPMWQPKPGKE